MMMNFLLDGNYFIVYEKYFNINFNMISPFIPTDNFSQVSELY